jgi:hypothetical protein
MYRERAALAKKEWNTETEEWKQLRESPDPASRQQGHLDNKLHIVGSFFCEFVSFPKLPLSLEPKLYIPSDGLVVFFPDFPGALSDLFFVGLC